MTSFAELLQQGSANAWWFAPSAIVLGVLHGLEPGHSKTMMAAFIVAIRGTVTQAALLGLSATISHTAVVWAVALGGMYFGKKWTAETSEPYFQMISAVLMVGVALWMLARTIHARRVFWHAHNHNHHHHHDHGLKVGDLGFQDAHEKAHAMDIQKRFKNADVTTGQIVFFGLTGGLIPCPAAITVLLLCLQLKEIPLGVVLVLCFSVGLALTLVASGVVAALSLKHVGKRWSGFGAIAARAPYFSSLLILAIGVYVGYQGWSHLP